MHHNSNNQLLERATSLRDIVYGSSAIRLNLEGESLSGIVLVMFCAIWMGEEEDESIYSFLRHHGATISQADVSFLLDMFTGQDCERHLWFRDIDGSYKPLLEALPEYNDIFPDDVGCDGVPA